MFLLPTPVTISIVAPPDKEQEQEQARQILKTCAGTHLKIPAFSANFRVTLEERKRGKSGVQTALGDIAFVRPGKSRLNGQLIDGTEILVVCDNQFRYRLSDKTPLIYLKDVVTPGDPALAQAIHDANVFGSPTFLEFTTSPQALIHLFVNKPRAYSLGAEEELDGVDCSLVIVEVPTSNSEVSGVFTFAIGKKDHLLRRMEMIFGDEQNGLKLTEEFDEVKANPELDPKIFVFSPPAGFKARAGTRVTPGSKMPASAPVKPVSKPVSKSIAKPIPKPTPKPVTRPSIKK